MQGEQEQTFGLYCFGQVMASFHIKLLVSE